MDRLRLRSCVADLRTLRITHDDGTEDSLSAREADLLRRLTLSKGATVDRATLYAEVWGYNQAVVSRALDATVLRLRRKIEADPGDPHHLLTMHGDGYRLDLVAAPPERLPAPGGTLVAVGLDPTTRGAARWHEQVAEQLREAGGVEVAREGDEHLVSFLSAARGATFVLALIDAGADRGARGAGVIVRPAPAGAIPAPADEAGTARVRRILSAASRGQVLFAADLYEEVAAATGVRGHSWEMLRARIRGQTEVLAATGGDPSCRPPSADGNLVPPATSLVGRDREQAAVLDHLDDGRWVTITGTGGVGKTALALDVGRVWRDGGGAWFCDLSGCRTAADVERVVAAALGVPLDGRTVLAHALAGLPDDLVVLDNAEQVLAPIRGLLVTWTRIEPGARLLVTSRERFGVPGERVVALEPLGVDDGVRLFGRQATLEVDDPDAVRAIVERVGGLPLAVELAAARTEVLTPRDLLGRLDERLSAVGSDGARIPRHVDLDAMVRWSWELLPPDERRVLAGCLAFASPFTVADAEEVVDGTVDDLQALRRKRLLQAPSPGRLAPYAAVRSFVLGAAEPADLEAARDRHARWFARWGAAEVETRLDATGGQALLARITHDLPELLVAIEHAVDRDPDAAVGVFLGATIGLHGQGPLELIESLAQRVLPLGLETGRIHRARLTHGAPVALLREVDEGLASDPSPRALALRLHVVSLLGDTARGRAMRPEIVAAVRASGDEAALARALMFGVELLDGEVEAGEVREATQEVLELCRRRGDRGGQAVAWSRLAQASRLRGDRDVALHEARSALEAASGLLDGRARMFTTAILSGVHRVRAEAGPALRFLEEMVAESRRVGDLRMLAVGLANLGYHHALFTDTAVGRRWLDEALTLDRAHGFGREEASALGNVGSIDLAEGRLDDAIARFTEATALFARIGYDSWGAPSLADRGWARAALGDPASAFVDLDRAIDLAVARQDALTEARALGFRGVLQARLGDHAGAAADLARAEERFGGTGPGFEGAEVALIRAEHALGSGQPVDRWLDRAEAELVRLGIPTPTLHGRWLGGLRLSGLGHRPP